MPSTQELKDGDTWIIELPFVFVRANGQRIIVPPSGLGDIDSMLLNPVWTTDYGSIPQAFQSFFRKDGVLAPIYVVHDWIYASEMFPRAVCDEILIEGAQELGYDLVERNIIYDAVRVGGEAVWNQHDINNVTLLQAYYNTFTSEVAGRWPMLLG